MSDIKISGISIHGNVKPEAKAKRIEQLDKVAKKSIATNQDGLANVNMSSQVEKLKQQIQNNEYNVDVNKLADKLANHIILNL